MPIPTETKAVIRRRQLAWVFVRGGPISMTIEAKWSRLQGSFFSFLIENDWPGTNDSSPLTKHGFKTLPITEVKSCGLATPHAKAVAI